MPFPLPGDLLPDGVVDVGADGVGLDTNGDLVLDEDSIEFHFLWVANDPEGTVSKLDTRTGQEVARYASVTHDPLAVVDHVGRIGSVPAWNNGQNHPSRTAVDFFGNVWVGNRAPGVQPSTTKIMNAIAECTDRNGNGVIDTSREVNGTPGIQLADPAEFLAEADECIRFTVVIGALTGDYGARALAIDSGIDPGDPGNAWVGMFAEQAFYQLDGKSGALIKRVPPTGALGVSPYGAAIDGVGRLWAPNGCCGGVGLLGFEVATGNVIQGLTVQSTTDKGSYGIAIDQANRVWLGGWPNAMAVRFDPATAGYDEVPVPGYFGAGWGGRGIGFDADGNVWVCMHQTASGFPGGAVARINTNTLMATGAWATGQNTPVGCAVDFDGNVWGVNQSSSTASRVYVNPLTNEPDINPATGNLVDSFATGANPYTYSDFTGFGLRNITRSSGDYTALLEGGADGDRAQWLEVAWDATTPPNTSVEVYVRAGDDPLTIDAAPIFGPWTVSAANLQGPPGPVPDTRYLKLIIRLISLDRVSTPIVHSYDVKWACPTIPVD
jgi:hypothetical protein